ncbi:MAG: 30S ribosomal protein S1 [Acidiferrobacteraceae bacterium]|nr:30S ribosomal protein S1 [Acidiferrobacteraceae bacterium]|tara:strand:+ start:60789 stop:62492 length:1704 start_codon:yes stop_codon:yes gene_type:complete
MSDNFAELLEESLKQAVMRPGAVIQAEVVSVNTDFVTVDAGLKSEAEIPVSQFKDAKGDVGVNVGDRVDVSIEAVEDGYGNTRLSREKARREKSWEILEKAFEHQTIVKGQLTGKVKGGFTVSIDEVRAFLPGSLVDVRPVTDSAYLEHKELEFKVIKLDRPRNNVVVSRRAIVEKELQAERSQLLETLDEGQVVKGVIKNLTDYGAFVNLGGLDGLLHITDIAWKRVKHPSEVLEVGQEIDVRVLKFDRERNRVSLGIKQLGEDPWADISRRYAKNTRLFGKVTNLTDYGAFVELEEGVEGLVHVSEMDWTNKNVHPSKICDLGDEIEVMVLDVDTERRRISLGMKQCVPNPWEEFASGHSKGERITGSIKSITDFGVFIGLDGNIDGLIHLSDLSWEEPGEEVARQYKKGDELTAVVLSVDPDRERISLGVKQALQDPFTAYVSQNSKGSIVKGEVKLIEAKSGITIQLSDGVDGFIRVADLSREISGEIENSLPLGSEIEAKITSIERKNRKILLSVKALEIEIEGQAIQDYGSTTTLSTSMLGDKLREKLSMQEEHTDSDEDE